MDSRTRHAIQAGIGIGWFQAIVDACDTDTLPNAAKLSVIREFATGALREIKALDETREEAS
jgi:hypothetical protein